MASRRVISAVPTAAIRLAVVASLLVAGCARRPQEPSFPHAEFEPRPVREVPDYVANPLVADDEIHTGPRRIISTSPQLTEIACALGLRDQLVGRSSYCRHPPGIEDVPNVGALLELNLEQVIQLEPDLVLISGRSELIRNRLSDVGLKFVSLPDSSLEDVYHAITELGRLAQRERTAATLIAAIKRDLARLIAEYPASEPLNVLLLTARLTNPPRAIYAAGPGSYLSTLLEMIGHRNAAARLKRAYAQISLEEILHADPDLIVEFRAPHPAGPQDYRQAYDTWSQIGPLNAIRNRRLRLVAEQMHLVPGPRVAMTLRELIRNLPE